MVTAAFMTNSQSSSSQHPAPQACPQSTETLRHAWLLGPKSYLTPIFWEFLSPLSLVTCRICSFVRHFWLLSLPLPPNFSASTDRQPQSVLPRAARRASQIKCTSWACSTSARALPSNRSLLWPASYEALCEMPSSFCDLITCAFPHSLLSSQWHLADPSTQNLFLSVPCALPPACGIRPLIFLSPARSWFRSHLCREALPGLSSMHALSRSVVSGSSVHGEFSRQEYCSGLPLPSPWIFPNQGRNPSLLHCRQTASCLSHQGSPSNLSIPLPCFLFLAFTTTSNSHLFKNSHFKKPYTLQYT